MLEDILQQRFATLQNRSADSWYAALRQEAWDVWRKHYSVTDLPESWREELLRAASPSLATKAAEKAVLDARNMWRRMAAHAEERQITQEVSFVEGAALPLSVRAFLRQCLFKKNESSSPQHALASLQLALLSEVWWVRAAAGSQCSNSLQPPPSSNLWDELFSLHVFDVAAEAQLEVVSGCMAPKGARAHLVFADVASRARLTWTSMSHAPSTDAETGTRRVVLHNQAHCIWRDVRLNAGPGLRTDLATQDDATLVYQGLWAGPFATDKAQVLEWLEHRSDLWLLGNFRVPAAPQAKSFQMPPIEWVWRTVQVPDEAWRQFCLEQFLLPFLQNLPVEYQTDIVRFAELSFRRSK